MIAQCLMVSLFAVLTVSSLLAQDVPETAIPAPKPTIVLSEATKQLVVVTNEDWPNTRALLHRFYKEDQAWKPVGAPWQVRLGRSGMGWAENQRPAGLDRGPDKVEGDGRSPAGIFSVSSIFGDLEPADRFTLPFLRMTKSWRCVDDPASKNYNQLVDSDKTEKDWKSAEQMILSNGLYKLGAVINANPANTPKKGSCLFLHIGSTTTLGCTAMEEANLATLLEWLDLRDEPRLIQMTRRAYEAVKAAMPELPVLE
jgi:zinc D-Ala-D-Ala dipeptidase